jgi:predicted transcriptional regulator
MSSVSTDEVLHIRLDVEIMNALRKEAEAQDRLPSYIARQFIKDGLKSLAAKAAATDDDPAERRRQVQKETADGMREYFARCKQERACRAQSPRS